MIPSQLVAAGRRRLELIAFATFAIALPCFAWGPDGHRIIADIAELYLTPQAKAAIKDLLGDQSLADVSDWADKIRDQPQYEWTKPLHYINAPRSATKVNLERDCGHDKCVVAAINKNAEVLRDPKSTRDQRIESLKFLVHYVGDVHQPLHVSYEDDKGGNFVKVTWMGDATWNFHSVWDSALIKKRMNDDRLAMTKAIEASITGKDLRTWRQSTNPVAWANESLTITRRLYKNLPADRQLDVAYYNANISTVETQLAVAGVRLAAMLNDIFAPGDKADPASEPAQSQPESPATPASPAPPATQPQ
jgi:hypothetical protein